MRARTDRQCRCGAVIGWYSNVCQECSLRRHFSSQYLSGAKRAHGIVARARSNGVLPDPRTMLCADCDGPATEHDHRDYNEPLEVNAVCRGCNARRGKAIPKRWNPGEWIEYIKRATKRKYLQYPHILKLHEQFKHELPPEVFGEAPTTVRAA